MLELHFWQWVLLALGASLVGLSKTGIAGVAILTVAAFANILPARESTGVLLPLLICGDIVAVAAYRRHAVWSHLLRLSPWVAVGVVLGYLVMGRIQNDTIFQRVIGIILLALVILHVWRQLKLARDPGRAVEQIPRGMWFAAIAGILAGFTTMVANAAGPIMILYMLSMQLPKMEFLGTAAWFFMILNIFKVPFSYHLGLINPASLAIDLRLAIPVILGAFLGRAVATRINQKLFENLALAFTTLAVLRMLF